MSERLPKFEWDENKNESNLMKHAIDFWDAIYVWADPYRQERYDALHSTLEEDRWQTIGMSRLGVLMVIYTDKVHDPECDHRIISARVAEPHEERLYHERRFGMETG